MADEPGDWAPLGGTLPAWSLGDGRRVVLVHGFTQTARSLKPLASLLHRPGRQCVVVDLPGHGDAAGVAADLPATADLLAACTGRATYVGYSLGGRACLHLALRRPETVEGLVLIGANPGIDDPAERAARREADERLAERIVEIGVPAFLDEWLAQPLFAGLDEREAERADRLGNTAEGLAASLRLAGTGVQEPLWSRLGELTVPVLVLAGELDQKFSAIGQRVAAAVRHGSFVAVPGATHAAHLQRPDAVAAAIERWLAGEVEPHPPTAMPTAASRPATS